MENGRDARNSSKEIDILIINNSSPTNHFTSDNNFHNNPLTDSNSNELGWKLNVMYFPKELLDEKERYYITQYIENKFVMYNIESGGTLHKEIIGERKPPKTYTQGVEYGEKKAIRRVKEFFDKYLDCVIKEPSNKIKERKKKEFEELLKGE